MATPDFDYTKRCAETFLHNGKDQLQCIYVQGHDGHHYHKLPDGFGIGWKDHPANVPTVAMPYTEV